MTKEVYQNQSRKGEILSFKMLITQFQWHALHSSL